LSSNIQAIAMGKNKNLISDGMIKKDLQSELPIKQSPFSEVFPISMTDLDNCQPAKKIDFKINSSW
jgi:Holliday junction resolvase RusA-like endonuclease